MKEVNHFFFSILLQQIPTMNEERLRNRRSSSLRKNDLFELFKYLDKVWRFIKQNDFEYPRGSKFFIDSVPTHLDSKEDVKEFLQRNIDVTGILQLKLTNWLREYMEYDFDSFIIQEEKTSNYSRDFPYLTPKELLEVYQPFNTKKNKIYSIEQIRNWLKQNKIIPVKRGGKRYSSEEFESVLMKGRVKFNLKESIKRLKELEDKNQ